MFFKGWKPEVGFAWDTPTGDLPIKLQLWLADSANVHGTARRIELITIAMLSEPVWGVIPV
jgi:hypothetical protein